MAHDEEMGLPDEEVPLLSKCAEDEGEQSAPHVPDCGGSDILQFSSPTYYADEQEGCMKIDIIRLGAMKGRIAVRFSTEDGTSKSDEQYEAVSGKVIFEDGEHTKTIDIPILPDGNWSPTSEFKVHVTHPENCNLGLYLYECRVKILNSDRFPTDEYAEDIDNGEEAINEIDDWCLFIEYCKLNFDSAGVAWQTVFVLIFDQLNNVIIFGNLWIGVYIVDSLFVKDGSSSNLILASRYHTALLIGLWFVVPLVVLHAWDTLKTWLDIKGASLSFLQKSVFRTYMDLAAESRTKVNPAELDMAIDESAQECADSYVAALKIVAILGRIITVALFIVLFQSEPFAVWTVLILPVVLVMFSAFRAGIAQAAQKRADEKMLVVATLTNEGHQKYRLIADYMKRPLMGDIFSKAAESHSEEQIPVAMIEQNTKFTTKFLSGLVICLYITLKTPDVFNGTVSLGIFLATIQIFGDHLAEAVTDLNEQLMIIIKAFVPIKELTVFFNLPLELPDLKTINRYRREQTISKRTDLLDCPTVGSGAFKSDLIPIEVTDLTFEYGQGGQSCVLKNVNISVPQGSMVAVVGPHSSGKSTFLLLLSNILIPTSGHIYVPSHLRVLHVSREPMFLRASLLQNLAFGLPPHMIDVDRIKTILRKLDLEDMIQVLNNDLHQSIDDARICDDNTSAREKLGQLDIADFADVSWDSSLNHSRKVKLHIARALIANPEVLVLDRALQALEEDVACEILDVLRKHVKERGLCLPEESIASRRPRNVFWCTQSAAQAAQADAVWQMRPDTKTIVNTTPQALMAAQLPRSVSQQTLMAARRSCQHNALMAALSPSKCR